MFLQKILLAVFLLFSSDASAPIQPIKNATFHIAQQTITDKHLCSATAVGPHAILTATHCELGSEILYIQGESVVYGILGRIRDEHDHTIFLLNGPAFNIFADIDEEDPKQAGEDVKAYGNPGSLVSILRKGYISGTETPISLFGAGPTKILFSFPVWYGDSGAAIFNPNNKIIAVITGTQSANDEDENSIKFTYSFVLSFSKEDINRARTFDGK